MRFRSIGPVSVAIFTVSFGIAFADVPAGLAALDQGDAQTAAAEFQASYEAGDGDGAFYLGRLFELGVGTDNDLTRAANLYAAGAERGSVQAMNRLGLMYLDGKTLLRDYAAAEAQFCKAADLGDQNGQLNCALMLKDGKGGDQDPTRAAELLGLAADQGNIAARNLLAQMLLSGDGVAADRERAMALFTETADAGNAMGLYELARLAMNPADGSEPDLVAAYSWVNLAAVRGHVEAQKLRDDLETQMSVADVAAAQQRSREWTTARLADQGQAEAGGN
jgi:uncharacterized protein